MYIDIHAHCYPEIYLDRLRALGSEDTGVSRGLNAGNDDEEVASRLRMMDDAGVGMQVLSIAPQLPIFADQRSAIDAARLANNLYAELVNKNPARFVAFAAAPLPHREAAVAECARAMDELGMVGVTVPTSVLGLTLADEALEPFWAELDRRAAIAFIHPTGCGAESPLITEHGLTWIVGAPFEDAIAVLHLLLGRVTVRYRQIRFVVAHLGGVLPFLLQRIDDNYDLWSVFPERPSTMFRKMWFDTANFYEPSLRLSCHAFGSERLLLGSDFPYFQGDLYTRAVDYVEGADLQRDERDAILWQNASALLRLAPTDEAP